MARTAYRYEIAGFSGTVFSVEELKSVMNALIKRFEIKNGTPYSIFRGTAAICPQDGIETACFSGPAAKTGFVGE